MTGSVTICKPRRYWGGHGGHGGHSCAHTYAGYFCFSPMIKIIITPLRFTNNYDHYDHYDQTSNSKVFKAVTVVVTVG